MIDDVIQAMTGVIASPDTPSTVKDWLRGLVGQLQVSGVPDARFIKGEALPATLGALADEYADVRQARLDKDKESASIKERETEIYNAILSALSESADTGASGNHHRVQRVLKTVNNVSDWSALHTYIQQTGAFEMLQRRLSDKAVSEFADTNGALPPGVQAVDVATLSFTKI
jgi:hypothetical protein